MSDLIDEWTEMSRFRGADGLIHATFAKSFGDNTKFRVCPALRDSVSERPEVSKDHLITCLICLGHLGG
jgi:hypothetical protein